MNILLNIFIIFLIILLSLTIRKHDIMQGRIIQNKVIIFFVLFISQFLILLIDYIRIKEYVDVHRIIRDSFETAIAGIIGYTFFVDMMFEKSYINFSDIGRFSNMTINLNISLIMIIFIILIRAVKLLFISDTSIIN
jgi:hypothetical protein